MKINNFLALGLIAVASGISTAQTYNATAGTSGVADIQSDYSMATGDGASVAVDVPLEFELPKKVALAVANGSTLPDNELFNGTTSYHTTYTSRKISMEPRTDRATTKTNLRIAGVVYANTAVSITFDMQDFLHETDPSSEIKVFKQVGIGKSQVANWTDATTYGLVRTSETDSSLSMDGFPATFNIDDTTLSTEGNKLRLVAYAFPYLDSIEPTDRAGKYLSTATITVSTL